MWQWEIASTLLFTESDLLPKFGESQASTQWMGPRNKSLSAS